MSDPTTSAIEALNADRARLSKAAFGDGYNQAVREIRDHFAKAGQHDVVAVIDTIIRRRL